MCSQKCANPGISTGSEHAPTCTFIATADVVESGSEHSNTFNPLGNVYVLYSRLSNGGLIILIGLVDSELSAINDDAVFDTVDDVSSSIRSAFAANGAKDVDARMESTRRRRVVLSASLNSTVLNFSLHLSPLSMPLLKSSEDDDVVVTLHNFLLALLILQKLLVDVDGKNPTAVGSELSNTSAPNQLQLYHQLWTIIDATRVYTWCRLPLLQSTGPGWPGRTESLLICSSKICMGTSTHI